MMQTLIFDPGHPTKVGDRGAVVPGFVESDYTLPFCRRLMHAVSRLGFGVACGMTRSRADEVVGLGERGVRSHDANADLVISVHVDWYEETKHHGSTAFYSPGDSVGMAICEQFLRSVPAPLHVNGREPYCADPELPKQGWMKNARNVLDPHKRAVLFEVGYCSNPCDLEALRSEAIVDGLVLASLSAIARWRQLTEPRSLILGG